MIHQLLLAAEAPTEAEASRQILADDRSAWSTETLTATNTLSNFIFHPKEREIPLMPVTAIQKHPKDNCKYL